jgi:hypothetical protein
VEYLRIHPTKAFVERNLKNKKEAVSFKNNGGKKMEGMFTFMKK